MKRLAVLQVLSMCIITNVSSQSFTDVTSSSGLNLKNIQVVAVFDYNNDDFPDLAIQYYNGTEMIYTLMKNNGDKTFSDVGAETGFPNNQVKVFDYNNDGYSDLAVIDNLNFHIYRNQEGTFQDYSTELGISNPFFNSGEAPANASSGQVYDFEGDGDLDFFFFRKNGTNSSIAMITNNYTSNEFFDVKDIIGSLNTDMGYGWALFDKDNDLDLDVVTVSASSSWVIGTMNLWQNDNGVFSDVTAGSGLTDSYRRSILPVDFNNDGFLDLVKGGADAGGGNDYRIYLNDGDGTFTDVSSSYNIRIGNHYFSLPAFVDFDNDFDMDIHWGDMRSLTDGRLQLYQNDGSSYFTEVSGNYGIHLGSTIGGVPIEGGSPSVFFDYDNDGDLDVFVSDFRYYDPNSGAGYLMENPLGGNYLKVKLNGSDSNNDGKGAKVVITKGSNSVVLYNHQGVNTFGTDMSNIFHIGLGDDIIVDELSVQWQNGNVDTYTNISANQLFEISESNAIDQIFISDTTIIFDNTAISNENLVSHYPFDGTAEDIGSYNSDGTVHGATLTTDKDGNANSAYYFDGVDDYISIPGNLPITDNFTIAFWGYTESTGGTSNVICDGSSNAGGNDFLLNFRGNEIGIRADKSGKSLNYEYSSPAGMTGLDIVNKWGHYVWVMNPNYSKIYFNGVEIAHIDIQGTNLGYHDEISVIGARQVWGSPDNFFKGKLDDIRIYDSELSPEQITDIYSGSGSSNTTIDLPVQVTDLTSSDNIISYQFDFAYDNSVMSYSGYDLSGTLSEGGTATVNSSIEGKLSVSYMNSSAIIGQGELIKLKFNPIVNDTTYVSISNAYLNNNSVQTVDQGQIILKEIDPPSAKIQLSHTNLRYADTLIITSIFDEPMSSANPVYLDFSGAVTINLEMQRINDTTYVYEYPVPKASGIVNIELKNGTDLWANVVDSIPLSGGLFSIIEFNLGDVDDDGIILAYDAALCLQYSVGLDPLPEVDPLPWRYWRDSTANVDGVGAVTANDASMILRYSAGIINSFDASAKKSVSQGFISIEVINNEIILYSYGDLLGLNISAINEDQILDTPIILADNLLSAFNISGTTYSVGICTANSPENGVALMKIPYTKSGAITLDMIINTEADARTLNLSYSELTGKEEYLNDKINIYPNPASDKIRISGIATSTLTNIYSADGKLMYSNLLTDPDAEINVSGFSSGLYIMKLETNDQIVIKRLAVE